METEKYLRIWTLGFPSLLKTQWLNYIYKRLSIHYFVLSIAKVYWLWLLESVEAKKTHPSKLTVVYSLKQCKKHIDYENIRLATTFFFSVVVSKYHATFRMEENVNFQYHFLLLPLVSVCVFCSVFLVLWVFTIAVRDSWRSCFANERMHYNTLQLFFSSHRLTFAYWFTAAVVQSITYAIFRE